MARDSSADVTVVRNQPGQPHAGKVFAAVHAHLSDVPHYAAGLCAKLMAEGYTGYLIRTTNDEKSGGQSIARNILSNEQEHLKMAAVMGFKDVFDLYYRNHFMDGIAAIEIQSRLVLLFRMLKVDTVISFNPSAQGDDDTDHQVTAHALQEAAWMAGQDHDFHEHFEAGVQPHAVLERYYFHVQPGQPFNRVVDVSSHIGKKIDAIAECRSQGGGNRGSLLRAKLAREGKRLALLGDDDKSADREYVRHFLLDGDRDYGKPYKIEYAERFYYVDRRQRGKSKEDEYVQKNAVRI
jgi:LmbE family N-acetylglucosaminyl deacetylase